MPEVTRDGTVYFEWTDEEKRVVATSAIVTREIRRGALEPEEGLLLAIRGLPPALDNMVEAQIARTPFLGGAIARTTTKAERHATREKDRYHNDPEYRAKRLAAFKARRTDPAYRERERLRKQRKRAEDRAAKLGPGAGLLAPNPHSWDDKRRHDERAAKP